MRILHLVHQYLPHFIGGTELYTQSVAVAQAEAGHDVALFVPTPVDSPVPLQRQQERDIRIYRVMVGDRNRTQIFLNSFYHPSLRKSWQVVLDEESPDLVHIQHLMGMPAGLVDDLIQRDIPYVVTLHDYWYVCANAQLLTNTDQSICEGPDGYGFNCAQCAAARANLINLPGAALSIAPLLNKRNKQASHVLREANGIIAPTEFVRDKYRSLVSASLAIDVLPHGIELPAELPQSKRPSGQLDDPLRVAYVGSVAHQKGVHVLVEAINDLAPAEVTLTIYGDLTAFPDYVLLLEGLIKRPGIEFAGRLNRDEFWSEIINYDVAVLPTLWYETSVLVIDEFNAVGIPIVASDIGVMHERIINGVNGRLFTAGDAAALREVLSSLIADPAIVSDWRRQIGPVKSIADHISGLEEIYAATLSAV